MAVTIAEPITKQHSSTTKRRDTPPHSIDGPSVAVANLESAATLQSPSQRANVDSASLDNADTLGPWGIGGNVLRNTSYLGIVGSFRSIERNDVRDEDLGVDAGSRHDRAI